MKSHGVVRDADCGSRGTGGRRVVLSLRPWRTAARGHSCEHRADHRLRRGRGPLVLHRGHSRLSATGRNVRCVGSLSAFRLGADDDLGLLASPDAMDPGARLFQFRRVNGYHRARTRHCRAARPIQYFRPRIRLHDIGHHRDRPSVPRRGRGSFSISSHRWQTVSCLPRRPVSRSSSDCAMARCTPSTG